MNEEGGSDPVPSVFPALSLWTFVVGGLVASIFSSAVFVSVVTAITGETEDLRILLAGQLGLWAGLVPAVWLAARSTGNTMRAFAGFRMQRFDPCWALLGPLLQVLISVAYAPFVSADELSKDAQRLVDLAKGQAVPYVLLSASTVIGAPIVEELFFRGLVVRAGRNAGAVVAVLASALLFGAVHLQPLQFPALVCFGALCAVLVLRFGRLGPSMWLHAGFNAATMATMAWKVFR